MEEFLKATELVSSYVLFFLRLIIEVWLQYKKILDKNHEKITLYIPIAQKVVYHCLPYCFNKFKKTILQKRSKYLIAAFPYIRIRLEGSKY